MKQEGVSFSVLDLCFKPFCQDDFKSVLKLMNITTKIYWSSIKHEMTTFWDTLIVIQVQSFEVTQY